MITIKGKCCNIDNATCGAVWPYFVVSLAVIIVHGLLIINDGIYWDDWLIQPLLDSQDWGGLYKFFKDIGLPFIAVIHWGASYTPDHVIATKLTTFISIIISALCIYRISTLVCNLGKIEGIVLSCIAIAYPAFQVYVAAIVMPYLVCYALFMVGTLIILMSDTKSVELSFRTRVSAALFFFLSFNLNSLLIFYCGFILLWWIFEIRKKDCSIPCMLSFALRRIEFVLLPFAYWFVKEKYFPRTSKYNSFIHSWTDTWGLLLAHVRSSLWDVGVQIWNEFSKGRRWWLLVVLFALIVFVMLRDNNNLKRSDILSGSYGLIAGIFLYICGIAAYISVGLYPDTLHGWETRHSLLVGLPIAVILIMGCRLVRGLFGQNAYKVSIVLTIVIVCIAMKIQIQNYVSWQARWVKDRAIIQKLAHNPDWKRVKGYWIEDESILGGDPYYRYYEWEALFRSAWGVNGYVGYDRKFYTFELNNLPHGQPMPEGLLRVVVNDEYNRTLFVAEYFLNRWIRQDGMADFLDRAVSVEAVFPLSVL
jgi:hypothetical protein